MNVITQVATIERQRNASAGQAFTNLVRDLAHEVEVAPDTVLSILDLAGKTSADLQTAVYAARDRKSKRDALARVDAEQNEVATLKAEIGNHAAVFEAARQAYVNAVQPLEFRIRQIQSFLLTTISYHADLFRNCPDESLVTRYRLANQSLAQATAANGELTSRIERNKSSLHFQGGKDPDAAKEYASRITRDEEQLPINRERITALISERDAIERQMVEA